VSFGGAESILRGMGASSRHCKAGMPPLIAAFVSTTSRYESTGNAQQ
jgi:hypothetical protein